MRLKRLVFQRKRPSAFVSFLADVANIDESNFAFIPRHGANMMCSEGTHTVVNRSFGVWRLVEVVDA